MSEEQPPRGFKALLRPSATKSILSLLLGGVVLGIIGVVAFDGVMHATSTDKFCTSCHEMDIPHQQVQASTHYSSASGMRATCADCHVPKEFVPKMVRKIEAAREVWGSITGVIDTPEKYAAHAAAMKQREINRLLANDSRECRNCHESGRMLPALQTAKARQYHQNMDRDGKTCISCHAGIAHPEFSEGLNIAMD